MQTLAVGMHGLRAESNPAGGHLIVAALAQDGHDVKLHGTQHLGQMRQGTVAMQHVQAGTAPIGPAATHASNRILQAGRTIDPGIHRAVHPKHPQGMNHLRLDVVGHHEQALAQSVASRPGKNIQGVPIEEPGRGNEQIGLPAAQASKQAATSTLLPNRGMWSAPQQRALHGIGHQLVTYSHTDRLKMA